MHINTIYLNYYSDLCQFNPASAGSANNIPALAQQIINNPPPLMSSRNPLIISSVSKQCTLHYLDPAKPVLHTGNSYQLTHAQTCPIANPFTLQAIPLFQDGYIDIVIKCNLQISRLTSNILISMQELGKHKILLQRNIYDLDGTKLISQYKLYSVPKVEFDRGYVSFHLSNLAFPDQCLFNSLGNRLTTFDLAFNNFFLLKDLIISSELTRFDSSQLSYIEPFRTHLPWFPSLQNMIQPELLKNSEFSSESPQMSDSIEITPEELGIYFSPEDLFN